MLFHLSACKNVTFSPYRRVMVERSLRVQAARMERDSPRAGEDPPRRDEAEERGDDERGDDIGGLSFLLFPPCFLVSGVSNSFRASLVACTSLVCGKKKN